MLLAFAPPACLRGCGPTIFAHQLSRNGRNQYVEFRTRQNGEIGQIYVVDDDLDICESIAWTLTSVGYSVAVFRAADEFLSRPRFASPSAVIVDMLLPGMTGVESLPRDRRPGDAVRICAVISGHADVASAVEAMHLGAIDLLEKPFSRERLLAVVNRVLEVARIRCKNRVEEDETTRRLQELSPRERDVFDCVAAGLVTEIARRLGISARTVDVHRSRIMQKLGMESPLQLANFLAVIERSRPDPNWGRGNLSLDSPVMSEAMDCPRCRIAKLPSARSAPSAADLASETQHERAPARFSLVHDPSAA